MRAVFFGTPEFAIPTLKALNDLVDVTLVVTQEDKRKGRGKKLLPTPVKSCAESLNIPVYQPSSINDEEALAFLKEQEADLFIVVAYGQILSKALLSIPKKYIMNVHSSILPKYRGAAPMQWAILNGDEKTGVSLMQIEEGLDNGPVYDYRYIDLKDKNFGKVHDELAELGADVLRAFIADVEKDKVVLVPQDDSQATYAPKIDETLLTLNLETLNQEEFIQKVRAFSPEPGAHLDFRGERLKIYDASAADISLDPATFYATKKQLYIGTQKGSVSIKEIQRPGKKRMAIGSFLAGAHLLERGKV